VIAVSEPGYDVVSYFRRGFSGSMDSAGPVHGGQAPSTQGANAPLHSRFVQQRIRGHPGGEFKVRKIVEVKCGPLAFAVQYRKAGR
jgi:hypothetical protein